MNNNMVIMNTWFQSTTMQMPTTWKSPGDMQKPFIGLTIMDQRFKNCVNKLEPTQGQTLTLTITQLPSGLK